MSRELAYENDLLEALQQVQQDTNHMRQEFQNFSQIQLDSFFLLQRLLKSPREVVVSSPVTIGHRWKSPHERNTVPAECKPAFNGDSLCGSAKLSRVLLPGAILEPGESASSLDSAAGQNLCKTASAPAFPNLPPDVDVPKPLPAGSPTDLQLLNAPENPGHQGNGKSPRARPQLVFKDEKEVSFMDTPGPAQQGDVRPGSQTSVSSHAQKMRPSALSVGTTASSHGLELRTQSIPKTPVYDNAALRMGIKSTLRKSQYNSDMKPVGVFDFKEQVKRTIMKKPRDVTHYYKKYGIWQQIARSQPFETITLGVITANALWIAIDTDYNNSATLINAHWVFQVVENLFCCYFSFELLVRFLAFKKKDTCLKDAWFIFDGCLVVFMILETWVMTTIFLLSTNKSAGQSSLLGNAAILRMARLLRLSRMARMARLVRAVPELAILIKGMIASIRSVATTFWLLGIVLYIFSIMFAQLTDGTEAHERWSSVPRSMYTLWLYGVLCLDFAEEITDEFLDHIPTAYIGIGLWVVYYIFILLATFTIMNMLIGVLCEVVSAVAASEKEALLLQYARSKLKDILRGLDLNADGAINHKEFAHLVSHKDACLLLHDLGIDVVGLLDFGDVIFEVGAEWDDDEEEDEFKLDFDNFVDLILQLRGTSYSTVKDIVELRKLIRSVLSNQQHLVDNLADSGIISYDAALKQSQVGGRISNAPMTLKRGRGIVRAVTSDDRNLPQSLGHSVRTTSET